MEATMESRAGPPKAVTVCLEEFEPGRLVYVVKVGEVREGAGMFGGAALCNLKAVAEAEPLVLKELPLKGEPRLYAEKWAKTLGLPLYSTGMF